MRAVKVLPKGQITIPKSIRKKFNISVGDPLLIQEKGGEIILKKTKTIFDFIGILPDSGLSISEIRDKAAKEFADESK